MAAVFLDDVTELNAPLLACPGSHHEGLIPLTYRPGPDGSRREDRGAHTFDDLSAVEEERLHLEFSSYQYATAEFSGYIEDGTVADIVARRGIESITAAAGSLLLMQISTLHASTVNMSPQRRLTIYLNLCPVDNRPGPDTPPRRPWYFAAREFGAIEMAGAGCLADAAAEEEGRVAGARL